MNQIPKKTFKILVACFCILAVVFACLLFWLYSGQLTPAKIKIFKHSSLPAALVNGSPILMRDYIFRTDLAQKTTPPNPASGIVKQNILSQLINEQKIQNLAAKNRVFASQKQIDAEYSQMDTQTNLSEQLTSFGISPGDYKNQIIKPEMTLRDLQIWFNGQQSENKAVYDQANNLADQIKKGGDMGALAQQYSQDPTSKAVKGDLGFVEPKGLLHELQEPVDALKVGDVKILPSRYGLHIIKLEEKNGNSLHLRQIFLSGVDFNVWLKTQTQNFKIKILI